MEGVTLEYFMEFSRMLNDTLINDLHEEREAERRAAKRAEMLAKKKAKEPTPDLGEEKEKKVKTFVLQANEDSDAAPMEMLDDGDSDSSDGIVEVEDEGDAPGFQFSKMHVPTKADTNTEFKKGKNKYQKLREAIYREKLEAEKPVESTWEKIKEAAAGGKVEATAAQIRKGIKNEKRQKKKNYEKKVEKAEKQKKKEEWEAKAKKAKARKGKSFGKH